MSALLGHAGLLLESGGGAPPVAPSYTYDFDSGFYTVTGNTMQDIYTGSARHSVLRIASALSSGKYCLFVRVNALPTQDGAEFGLVDPSSWPAGRATGIGEAGGSLGIQFTRPGGLYLRQNGGAAGYGGVPTHYAGDTLMMAVDLTAGAVWYGCNGTWDGSPAAGTGNVQSFTGGSSLIPAISLPFTGQTCTMLTSDQPYTLPSGFDVWPW